MGISLGPVVIDPPVILAPMSGVTDAPFRRLVQSLGVGAVVTEMIAGQTAREGNERSRRMMTRADKASLHIVQLAGCEPGIMADAARYAADMGADVIDINMGCPVKKVVHGQAGSALMRDLRKALQIIESTVNAVSLPVTLKMRTGWDERTRNAPELARRAAAAGIRMVTVHGRTRSQFFNGRADWRFIGAVKDAIDIPLIANGDVVEVEDGPAILAAAGADGVMIGRGACGRPWFPAQVIARLRGVVRPRAPSLSRRRDIALAHYDAMLCHYGVARGVRIARKHLGWYLADLSGGERFGKPLLREADPARVISGLRAAYDSASKRVAA